MNLFPPEDLERAHDRYLHEQEQTRPKTKAEILCEIATEDPTCTVAELAEAADHSKSWVRKHLRAAGITLVKPVREKGAK
jgi:transposase